LKSSSSMLKIIFSSIFIITLLVIFWPKLMEYPEFEKSFSRVFSYISSEGIEWDSTSGRNDLYEKAIEYISKSPIIGYGVFGMFSEFGFYPHNLILEVLLQGGLVYLILILFCLFYF